MDMVPKKKNWVLYSLVGSSELLLLVLLGPLPGLLEQSLITLVLQLTLLLGDLFVQLEVARSSLLGFFVPWVALQPLLAGLSVPGANILHRDDQPR